MNTTIAVIIGICLTVAQSARGDEGQSGADSTAKPSPPTSAGSPEKASVVVTTLKGETFTGELVRWLSSVGLVIRNMKGNEIEIDNGTIDLVRVNGATVQKASGDWELVSADGSRLMGAVVGGDGERVRFRGDALGETTWSIESVRSIHRAEGAKRDLAMEPGDRVILRNGDSIEGTVSIIDEKGVTVSADDGEAEDAMKWASIASVVISESGDRLPAGPAEFRVRLADGGEAAATSIDWQEGAYELTLGEGPAVRVETSRVVSIESTSGGRVWLSGLQPVSYESTAFFSTTWPLRRDVNAVEGPLRVAGMEYGRGLGLHSACRATWRLDGKYSRLTGLVGIDDTGGRLADADFAIRAGSVVLYEVKGLRHGVAAKAVDLDVKDLAEITIDVGFGKNGDVQDRVDFVNAALKK